MGGHNEDGGRILAYKYEAVFCIFLSAIAYLGRENANLVYPAVLYLFLTLLTLNFLAIFAVRRWPSKQGLSAAIILANCGVITALLSYSGGVDSNLWVLYLLPIYTAALLLDGRDVAWITAGAVCFNTVFYAVTLRRLGESAAFGLFLKDGLFLFSAAAIWRLASAERRSRARIERQREQMRSLENESRAAAARDPQTERFAALGLMSAGIVHDLRTPLAVILGFAEICLQNQSLDSEARRDVQKIRRAADRCRGMLAGILSAVRDDDEPLRLLDLRDVVDSALELCAGTLIGAGVEVRKRLDPEPLCVLAARVELERLLMNLAANAVQAMRRGGVLSIGAVRSGADALEAAVIVEDTGPGIPAEAMANLFQPMNTTRRREGGNGLGLYFCRETAFKHGGGLKAENLEGGGARFTLSLPLAAQEAPGPHGLLGELEAPR